MSTRDIFYPLIVLSVALILGLLGFILFPKIPTNPDAICYFTAARNLLTDKGLVTSLATPTMAFIMGVPHPEFHMPGWPLFLSGFMWLTKTGIYAPALLNILLVIASSVLAYFTVLLWSDREKALWGALFFTLFPGVVVYEFTGLAETPLVFWIMLSVFLASLPRAGRSLACVFGVGVTLFLAYITREIALLFLPLVLVILRERGGRWLSLGILAGIVVLACLFSSYFYTSHYPGFPETNLVFTKYSALFKTGTISDRQNPMWHIVTPEDFPELSPLELAWLLLKKPLRLLVILARSKSWETMAMDALTVGAIILAPIMARGKWLKIGLAFLVLFIPAMFTLYHPKTDYLMRIGLVFGAVAVVFIATRIRIIPIARFFILVALALEFSLGALYSWGLQREARLAHESFSRAYPLLRDNLAPGARVIGIRGFGLDILPLYFPNAIAVLYPDNLNEALRLNERLETDALVFATGEATRIQPYPGLESLGWQEQVFPLDGDTVFIYTRPR